MKVALTDNLQWTADLTRKAHFPTVSKLVRQQTQIYHNSAQNYIILIRKKYQKGDTQQHQSTTA